MPPMVIDMHDSTDQGRDSLDSIDSLVQDKSIILIRVRHERSLLKRTTVQSKACVVQTDGVPADGFFF